MGKGFDEFMKNPYWKGFYENAPTDLLKSYLRLKFDNNYFVVDIDSYKKEEYLKQLNELEAKFSNVEWQYLYDNAEGGMEKSYYNKHLK